MLTPAGDVKVMDFGIARAMSDAHSTMTQTAAVVGTAQYLSPEQARGETVDSRSDVYSTGCLLYELLTGRPPFVGDSPVSVAYQHVREQAAPPSTLDDELPPEVDAIVMKALAKPLTERYQSAAAMKADIDRYLAGKPVQAPIPVPAGADDTTFLPADGPTTVAQPVGDEDDAPEKRDRTLLILLVLLVLAILVAGLILLPKLLDNGPPQETVPALAGMTQTEAERALTDAGLRLGQVSQDTSPDVPAGSGDGPGPRRRRAGRREHRDRHHGLRGQAPAGGAGPGRQQQGQRRRPAQGARASGSVSSRRSPTSPRTTWSRWTPHPAARSPTAPR